MPLVYADRVQETTLTVGTGALTLLGAASTFQGFSVIGVGNTTYYTIVDSTAGTWEVGIGTVGVGSITRDTVLASSNANALVNFGVGTKSVFVVSPATFFTTALSTTGHAAINHTGLPGVPLPETFTAVVHATTNHTGITGVPPPEAFTALVHAGTNHTGLPGVSTFTAPVHAATDHTGITGAGLTTKQSLIFPVSIPHQYWTPNSSTGLSLDESFLPKAGFGGEVGFAVLDVDDEGGANPTSFSYITTTPGFGGAQRYFEPQNVVRMESTNCFQNLLPRLVVKAVVFAPGNNAICGFGLGGTASHTGTMATAVNAVYVSRVGVGSWTVERRIASVSQASTPTGVVGTTAIYALFNYTSTTSVTVTLYDVTTFAVLFTVTFSGANAPATSVLGRVRLHLGQGNFPYGYDFRLGSMLLSFND